MSDGHNAFFDNLMTEAEHLSDGELLGTDSIDISAEQNASSPLPYILFLVFLALLSISWVSAYDTGIQLFVAFIGAALIASRSTMTKDPYGLFHLTLNRLPGDDPGIPPQTEWLNMGFWRDTDVFPHACAALAVTLTQAAGCMDGGKVLDVGYGTGESLVFLLSDHRVPRPSSLIGITSLVEHHRRAQDRMTQLQFSLPEPTPEVVLLAGDAVYHYPALNHPLDPSLPGGFDTILALDCAYHFHTRSTFLKQSFVKLVPGGRIALADICIDPSALGYGQAWLITYFFKLMPKQNMVSTKEYVSVMKEIGYVDVQLQDITKDVFPGFVKFLKGKGWAWWAFALVIDWLVNAGAKFVIVTGTRN